MAESTPGEAAPTPPLPPPPTPAKKKPGCATWVVIILAVGLLLSLFSDDDDEGGSSSSGSEREYEAFDSCTEFVGRRLKSPGTAKFRNFFQEDGEVTVSGFGDGPFVVTSTVDSQNSFGATLRSSFTCTVSLVGETWHLQNLDFVDGSGL